MTVTAAVVDASELVTPEPPQVRAALVLAIDHGLSLHDAAYLWLAMALQLPLLTADANLGRAAVRNAVVVVGFQELDRP